MRGLWSQKLHQVCVSHKLVTDCRNSGCTIVFMSLPDTEGHWPSPVEAEWAMLWALLQGKKLSYGEWQQKEEEPFKIEATSAGWGKAFPGEKRDRLSERSVHKLHPCPPFYTALAIFMIKKIRTTLTLVNYVRILFCCSCCCLFFFVNLHTLNI